jgi:hypothetical protein
MNQAIAFASDDQPRRGSSRPSPAELFRESIRNSQAAQDLVAAINRLAAELHVEVHSTHTKGGDLRICADRAVGTRTEQNIATLRWTPTKSRFVCGAYVLPNDCAAVCLLTQEFRQQVNKTWTLFPVAPGKDNAALLQIIRRAVRLFRAA